MEFFKQHWFKMLVLLPFIPVGILIHSLDRFTGIDDSLRFLIAFVFIVASLLLFFLGFYFELNKGDVKNKKIQLNIRNFEFGIAEISRMILSILTIGFFYMTFNIATMSVQVIDVIENIAAPSDVPTERAYSLVAMFDFDTHDRHYGRIGVLSVADEARDLATDEFLSEQNAIPNPIPVFFNTPFEMIGALYDDEVDAIIIGSNFVEVFEDLDRFEYIEQETRVLDQFTVEDEIVERIEIDPGEPFSILLMGLNSRGGLSRGNINTFMLLTINLEELSFTLVSIPRDSYVPIPCWGYVRDKLSHTNFGGSACAVGAIENMLDIEIPHYVRLNFTGFMELIDVLGGIEVDVPPSGRRGEPIREQDSQRRFGEYMIYLYPGVQTLNGEQALALARHRRSFVSQDFARVGNQQLVFQAMLSEMFNQVNGIPDLLPFLEVMSRSIETNLTAHDITIIAQYILSRFQGLPNSDIMDEMHFINMIVLGDPAMVGRMSVVFPWPGRIAEATRLMRINLGLEEPEFNFIFEFDGFTRSRRQWGGAHTYGSGISASGIQVDEPADEQSQDETDMEDSTPPQTPTPPPGSAPQTPALPSDSAPQAPTPPSDPTPPSHPSHQQRPTPDPPQEPTPPQTDDDDDDDYPIVPPVEDSEPVYGDGE